MTGLIIKGIGGFYYVKNDNSIYECRGRGIFKKQGIKLQVGDMVEFTEVPLSSEARKRGMTHEGVIDEIHERRNEFVRPPIVNVDTLAITFACKEPEPVFSLIDRFLVMAEMNETDVIIIMNKCDLIDEETRKRYRNIYSNVYNVIEISTLTGEGMDMLKSEINGRTLALAGPSGVGKSTIINALIPHASMETGTVSRKTMRGRHTTRHVEIFEAVGGGLVYDTPGFSSFDIMEAGEEDLQLYYPEFNGFKSKCFYDNCRHIKEPGCEVREAVRRGDINKTRYLSYKAIIEDIREKRKY